MSIQRNHYPLLLAICASLFTTPLMMAGVNAILPELGRGFSASASQLGLVGAFYSLGLAVFQLACGSLGDIWGHRRIFMIGGVIFAIASLAAGWLSMIYPFLLFRFIQGIGGAMLSAAGLALLAAAAPPGQRAAYLGVSGAAVYSGIACGPPVAGFITAAFGWRWLFYINAATNLCVLLIMKFNQAAEWRPAKGRHFDLVGCLLYALAMGCLTVASGQMSSSPWLGWSAIAVFSLLLGIFFLREGRIRFPMLNTRLLRKNLPLALSCVAALINYASFFGIIFYFSFYLQIAKGKSVEECGMILAFQPLVQALATPVATRLTNQWSAAPVCAAGALLCGAGLLACAFLSISSPIWMLFVVQAFLGAGMAAFSLANTAIILDSAGARNIGQASALTGAARTTGQLSSMIILTLILGLFLGQQAVSVETLPQFMRSMRVSLIFFGMLNICAVGLVLARNHKKTKKSNEI